MMQSILPSKLGILAAFYKNLIQLDNSELIFPDPFSIPVYFGHPAENLNSENL